MNGEEEASKSPFGQVLLVMQQISKDVGALTRDVGDNTRQNHAIAAQNVEVIAEIRKLGTEVVDMRSRIGAIERWIAEQGNLIPMRPRLPSMSDEDRRQQVQSIRTVALEAEKQTPYLQVIAKQSESQRPMLAAIAKSSKWTPYFTMFGAAAAAFAAGFFHSCGH